VAVALASLVWLVSCVCNWDVYFCASAVAVLVGS
jgi:hypothetical protein